MLGGRCGLGGLEGLRAKARSLVQATRLNGLEGRDHLSLKGLFLVWAFPSQISHHGRGLEFPSLMKSGDKYPHSLRLMGARFRAVPSRYARVIIGMAIGRVLYLDRNVGAANSWGVFFPLAKSLTRYQLGSHKPRLLENLHPS